jgi:hypothetical protein
MPALDDNIFDYFETTFYHLTSPESWCRAREEGLKADSDGNLFVLFTNAKPVVEDAANLLGLKEYVVLRFSPCYAGIPMPLPDDGAWGSHGCRIRLSRPIEPGRLEEDQG